MVTSKNTFYPDGPDVNLRPLKSTLDEIEFKRSRRI